MATQQPNQSEVDRGNRGAYGAKSQNPKKSLWRDHNGLKSPAMEYQRNLGFAIVGCGLIGHRRANTLPSGSLKFACDVDEERARQIANETTNCVPTTDLERVLSDSEVDVILVAAINAALAPITFQAVRAGKHVLVEKPGGIESTELAEIESAAAASGALVRIGYNHRFHPSFRKAYQLQQEEDLGEVMFIRGRYGHGGRLGYDREWRMDPALSGGGELIDQGVHLIDLAYSFLGEFLTVDGHAATYFWDAQVDDNAFLSLRSAGGQTAWLQVSCTEWKNLFSFEIYFQRAKLHVEGLGGSYGLEQLSYYKMLPEMGPPETTIYEFPGGDTSWSLEIAEFLEDIRLNRTPVPGLREGRRVLEIVERIYEKSGYGG
jgi:predicted dehydrogenase